MSLILWQINKTQNLGSCQGHHFCFGLFQTLCPSNPHCTFTVSYVLFFVHLLCILFCTNSDHRICGPFCFALCTVITLHVTSCTYTYSSCSLFKPEKKLDLISLFWMFSLLVVRNWLDFLLWDVDITVQSELWVRVYDKIGWSFWVWLKVNLAGLRNGFTFMSHSPGAHNWLFFTPLYYFQLLESR